MGAVRDWGKREENEGKDRRAAIKVKNLDKGSKVNGRQEERKSETLGTEE